MVVHLPGFRFYTYGVLKSEKYMACLNVEEFLKKKGGGGLSVKDWESLHKVDLGITIIRYRDQPAHSARKGDLIVTISAQLDFKALTAPEQPVSAHRKSEIQKLKVQLKLREKKYSSQIKEKKTWRERYSEREVHLNRE